MALTKKQLQALAGQKQNNLELQDFIFLDDKKYYIHKPSSTYKKDDDGDEILVKEGHKLNKLSFIGLDLLESNGIEYTLIAPKDGQEWCRAWF